MVGDLWRIAALGRHRLKASRFNWFAACSGAPSHCRPQGSGQGTVDGQTSTLEAVERGFRNRSLSGRAMSALGHKRTLRSVQPMSALLPKADIAGRQLDVRFVPQADSCSAAKNVLFDHLVGQLQKGFPYRETESPCRFEINDGEGLIYSITSSATARSDCHNSVPQPSSSASGELFRASLVS